MKNSGRCAVFLGLMALLLLSAWTHLRGIVAVEQACVEPLQLRGVQGKMRVKLRGIRFRGKLKYRYVVKKEQEKILYATYDVLSGEVTTRAAESEE